MSTFRLPRHSDVDLEFEGRLLSTASSWEQDKPRWLEISVFATDSGKWVAQRLGRSTKPGEKDLSDVRVCATPAEVRLALSDVVKDPDTGTRRYLTTVAQDALEAATHADPDLADALVERL